ncbi:lachrymatory-factor synthase-like [Vicia villosa]|uniref:lachrymatory-factor synthase-like n=1 Tax=Vicia villosa TaxID=3911 RepID=UPI00273B2691|nr:lachrymatory-factor synthase-like [Vicia villosa]
MEQELVQRWKGKVSIKLKNTTEHQAWPLIKDFFNLHKRFPNLATCYGIHGSNGEPGCIRYCAGFSLPSDGFQEVSWSKERLVAVDDVEQCLTYEIVDCNIGFRWYESTMRIIGDGDADGGCVIEWLFAVDPVEGLGLEDLVGKYRVGLQVMARKMEEEIATSVQRNEM